MGIILSWSILISEAFVVASDKESLWSLDAVCSTELELSSVRAIANVDGRAGDTKVAVPMISKANLSPVV